MSSSDLPLTNIVDLEPTDVICNGGYKSLTQNEEFSSLLWSYREEFEAASKLQRPVIALKIVNDWRHEKNGRFVKRDEQRSLWNDIGDKKSRELISKSLRFLLRSSSSMLDDENDKYEDEEGERYRQSSDTTATTETSHSMSTSNISIATSSIASLPAIKQVDLPPKSFAASAPLIPVASTNSARTVSASIRRNTRINRHLYGRSSEEQDLISLYQKSISACQESTDFLVISGESGVGKTALALSLKSQVVRDNGFFVHAKIEQLTPDDSLAAYISIFNDFCQLICEMKNLPLRQQFCNKIAEIMENLDEHMAVSTVPALGSVLELAASHQSDPLFETTQKFQKQTSSMGNSIREIEKASVHGTFSIGRLKYTFVKITRAVVSPQNPLVVLLDDLQYAPSYRAFEDFLMDVVSNQDGLFFLATFRTDNKSPYGPNDECVDEFLLELKPDYFHGHNWKLGGLPKEAIHELIADALSLESDKLKTLCQKFCSITGGNALFLLQILRTFQEDDLLRYDETTHQWKCDEHLISQHPLLQVSSLCDLFVAKIMELPTDVQETVKIASALGPNFSEAVLCKLLDSETVSAHCELAVEAGLFMKNDECEEDEVWAFCHDSIHNAAYGLIPYNEKSAYALKLAKRLWRKVGEKELEKFLFVVLRLFFGVGESALREKEDRIAVASLCLQAAERSVKSAGFHKAATYLKFGISALGDRKWRDHYELCLQLFNNAVEAYYGIGQFNVVEELINEILEKARWFEDSIQARLMKTYTLGTTKRSESALNHGLESLALMGEKVPSNPTKLQGVRAIMRTRFLLRNQSNTALMRLPLITDPKMVSAMMMMQVLFLNAYYARPFLAAWIACRVVELTLTHGACAASSVGFAGYGVVIAR